MMVVIMESSKDFDKRIIEQYPNVFHNYNDNEYMRYIDLPVGWQKVFEGMIEKIELICKLTNIKIYILQVKEKFGSLRFYYNLDVGDVKDQFSKEADVWCDTISDITSCAEYATEYICETCGDYGRIYTDIGWHRCLCKKHYQEIKDQRDNTKKIV